MTDMQRIRQDNVVSTEKAYDAPVSPKCLTKARATALKPLFSIQITPRLNDSVDDL